MAVRNQARGIMSIMDIIIMDMANMLTEKRIVDTGFSKKYFYRVYDSNRVLSSLIC
jgi:hypothetical protein